MDPLFDKLVYLKPYVFFPYPPIEGTPIPHREIARLKHPWENWIYRVVQNVNQKGVGVIRVYRLDKRIAQAPVADWFEADRVFEEVVEAAKAVTKDYEKMLGEQHEGRLGYAKTLELEQKRRKKK